MTAQLRRLRAAVSVPATSANLGPGFDCFGLALDIRDSYEAEVVADPGVQVASSGQGSSELPGDETHLVARSMLRALDQLGVARPAGLRLTCRNAIPQGRGLGSSAAAIVGGVALAHALVGEVADRRAEILELAAAIEGHPDNVAPAVLGGFTISWLDGDNDGGARAVSLPILPEIGAVLFIPGATSPTAEARAVLPDSVAMSAAVHNASRSALLVAALTQRPDLLLAATADRLHQESRRAGYPEAMALVDELRASGTAAAISGAGPTVVALTAAADVESVAGLRPAGFQVHTSRIGAGVAATRDGG